jgi:hypothetical protein
LIDPEKWIFSYYPRSERSQFLTRPVSRREFEDWPVVSPHLLKQGVSAARIRETIRETAELVKVSDFPDATAIVEVPLNRVLESGRKYEFVIRSTDFDQITLLDGEGRHTALEKKGDTFSGNVVIGKGVLRVGGKPAESNFSMVLLEYTVK